MRLDHLLSTENSGHCLVAGVGAEAGCSGGWFPWCGNQNLRVAWMTLLGSPTATVGASRACSRFVRGADAGVRWWLENWRVDASDMVVFGSLCCCMISTET